MLDYSEYIHTGWKSDEHYMNEDESQSQAIFMCEFDIHHNNGLEIGDYNNTRPIKEYYPLPKPVDDAELFALLSLRLDTVPSWFSFWFNKLDDVTLYPKHQKYEQVLSISDWSLKQDEILALRKHKRVMHLYMQEAWLFSMTGDMFGGFIKPRHFNCHELNDGMPGGNHRDFWALKEPTPLTKGDAA
jgi:hypothetical protein